MTSWIQVPRVAGACDQVRYKNPLNLALSPDGKELWVTCEAAGSVIVVDTASRQKIAEIPVGGQPNDVAFTPPKLVDYLSSHSNVIAAVEGRGESLAAVRKWILDLVTPFFRGPRATFQFGGTIWYVQKMGPSKRSLRRRKRQASKAKARKRDAR